MTFIDLGSLYLYKSMPDSTDYYFDRAYEIVSTLQNNKLTAEYYREIGDKYFGAKNYYAALDYYRKALLLCEQVNDRGNEIIINYLIGVVYSELGNYNTSINYLKKSLKANNEFGSIDITSQVAYRLYIAYREKGDYKNALDYYTIHDEMSDSIFSERNIEEITKTELQYKFDKILDEQQWIQREKDLEYQAEMDRQNWQKKTTVLVSLFIIVFLAAIIILIRIRQKQKEKQLKDEINKLMQRALSQQMNPHFIFNTLSSIQDYILTRDRETSTAYLSKFADLMRVVLDNSQHPLIPIKREIDALELYLELRQLQKKALFDYQIQIDDIIDTWQYKIPALLIQPFAENSIIYGFSNMAEKGILKVQLIKEDDSILCSIEDNGIGRSRAAELNSGGNKKYKSLSTDINRRRLELITSLYKEEYKIQITDLMKDQEPAGTRIELTLPILI